MLPDINISRAEYRLCSLRQSKVSQRHGTTLDDDATAQGKPVFTVKAGLELQDSPGDAAPADAAQTEAAAKQKPHKETRTIEIVPGDNTSNTPFFYGRLKETGELFFLRYEDAQGLAGNMLDL